MDAPDTTLIPLQQGATNTSLNDLSQSVVAILANYAVHLKQPASRDKETEQFSDAMAFLQALAQSSPLVEAKLKAFSANTQNLTFEQKKSRLCDLLLALSHEQKTIASDLALLMERANEEVIAGQKQMSRQLKAVLAEKKFVTDEAHKAHAGNAPYDSQRYLGHLIEPLLREEYLVPIDEENYVRGFEFKAPNENAYETHLREKFGGNKIFPPGLK